MQKKTPWSKLVEGADGSPCFEPVLNTVFFLGLLIGLPVLILTGVIPFSSRYGLLLAAFLMCSVFIMGSRPSWKEIGIYRTPLRDVASGIFVGLLFSIILGLYFVSQGTRGFDQPSLSFVAFYAVVSVPAQEFIYRSALFYGLRSELGIPGWFRILISTALYSLMHAIYQDASIVLATIVFGIVWGIMYERKRSLPTVCISHFIVGVSAFLLGLG